ncbi:MAG: flagellar FlbD family protein [Acidothermaceae bacterium]
MIVLTRLNGPSFALNPDLIERVDANPDTVVTLVGGIKYVVAESLDELLDRVREFRGQVIATAYAFESAPPAERNLHVVTDPADPDLPRARDV